VKEGRKRRKCREGRKEVKKGSEGRKDGCKGEKEGRKWREGSEGSRMKERRKGWKEKALPITFFPSFLPSFLLIVLPSFL
jgi:hypothetical protein